YQIPPSNGMLSNKNLNNMAPMNAHVMFGNKARFGMLPQPQQPQFVTNSNLASMNSAYSHQPPANSNIAASNHHSSLPHQQLKPQAQQRSPASYTHMSAQPVQYSASNNNQTSEHPNQQQQQHHPQASFQQHAFDSASDQVNNNIVTGA